MRASARYPTWPVERAGASVARSTPGGCGCGTLSIEAVAKRYEWRVHVITAYQASGDEGMETNTPPAIIRRPDRGLSVAGTRITLLPFSTMCMMDGPPRRLANG